MVQMFSYRARASSGTTLSPPKKGQFDICDMVILNILN